MTAENRPGRRGGHRPRRGRFNEAAADDRGKPLPLEHDLIFGSSCFNEAAADDRGKPPSATSCRSPASTCFNEAAADDRGKPPSSAAAEEGAR